MTKRTQQKLIIVTGSPCVGKTTVTDKFFESYKNSAFLQRLGMVCKSFFWLHLEPYQGDYVINTDNKSIQQIVDEMKRIIDNVGFNKNNVILSA